MQLSLILLGIVLRVLYLWGTINIGALLVVLLFQNTPRNFMGAVFMIGSVIWFAAVSYVGSQQLSFSWNKLLDKGESPGVSNSK